MGDNAAQISDWNGVVGERWAQLQSDLDPMVAPFGAAALQAAAFARGESAIDVGCGCGDTALQLARTAGPAGAVLGIDVSAPMLAVARQRSAAAALSHLQFQQADAASAALPGGRDLVYSRFGVMFFDAPAVAFTNLRRALRPGGRMAFCCWRSPAENPWAMLPAQAVRSALSLPEPPADTHAPGPFAFAARDYLEGILRAAGFSGIDIQPFDAPCFLGDTLEHAVSTATRVGPAARLVREQPPQRQPIAVQSVRRALQAFDLGNGIAPPAAVWIVTARSP